MRLGGLGGRAIRRGGDAAARSARGLAVALAGLAMRFTYRRPELLVVGLLAASALAGRVVDDWHRRSPLVFDRLEVEPARPEPARAPRPERNGLPARSRREAGSAAHDRPARAAPPRPPTAEHPLDLNLAAPADLARLPGIGPRLASRIVARRDAAGGRFESAEQLASVPGLGARKAAMLRPLVTTGPSGGPGSGPPAAGRP